MKNSGSNHWQPLAGNGGVGDYCPDVAYRPVMKRLQQLEKMQKQQREEAVIRSAWN